MIHTKCISYKEDIEVNAYVHLSTEDYCPECHADLEDSDIDKETGTVCCSECGATFDAEEVNCDCEEYYA